MDNPARLVAHITASLDGYIAPADGSVDWPEPFGAADYGFGVFFADTEAFIMGGRPTISAVGSTRGHTPIDMTFHSCDPVSLAETLAPAMSGKSWVVGDGVVRGEFLAANLVERLDLFVISMLLGTGKLLFPEGTVSGALRLSSSETFENAMVWLSYVLEGAEPR